MVSNPKFWSLDNGDDDHDDDNDDDDYDDDDDDDGDDDDNPLWATKAALSSVFAVPTHVCHRQNCKHTNMSHPLNIQILVKI